MKSDTGRRREGTRKPSDPAAPARVEGIRHFGDLGLAFTRWCFCVVLVAAPWFYGCTREWTKELLAAALAGIMGLFFLSLIVRWRLPRIPPVAAVLALLILGYGWGMAWNAKTSYDAVKYAFIAADQPLPDWPGALDRKTVVECMKLLTGMIGAFWLVCDLSANPAWRRRVWFAIGIAGVSIFVLGLMQRISGAHDIFWAKERFLDSFFATYRYHANAGAFINLALPFIIGRAMLAFESHEGQISKAGWCMASLLAAVCPFVNDSRGSMLVSVLILGVFTGWLVIKLVIHVIERRGGHGWWMIWVALIPLLAGTYVLCSLVGVSSALDVWQSSGMDPHMRAFVYDAVWNHMIPASGLWGFGPGTFEIAFPFYNLYLGTHINGHWVYAHEDYLETIQEWGWIGASFWVALFFGGLGYAFWKLTGLRRRMGSESKLLLGVSTISLAGVLLHSLVDFPLQMASLQLYAAVALGFVWSVGRQSRR